VAGRVVVYWPTMNLAFALGAYESCDGPALQPTRSRSSRRARTSLIAVAVTLAMLVACATVSPAQTPALTAARQGGADAGQTRSETPPPPPAAALVPAASELPRGGRKLFPDYRLVGFCGTPGAPELGELQGNLPNKARKLEAQAAKYGDDRKLLPVFELIAVVVQSGAGKDGKYRRRVDDSIVDEYLRLARASKGILLLNIQPGQSDFVTEVKSFESYLHEPDVGIALDPEWAMRGKQTPGKYYGNTDGQTINDVAAYLSDIIEKNHLPEKALVFHQVNRQVFSVKEEADLKPFPGVAVIKSVDGLGPMHSKIETYNYLVKTMTTGVHAGFKLFFDEDTRIQGSQIMSPKQVLALTPRPEYVMYE
jgi:hypothetical protein